jgi:hypothetical protein
MKMDANAGFYDITLIGELLGLELEVDRKQVRVTHDVPPPSPTPVWVPQLAVVPGISREHGTIRQAEDGTSSEDAVRSRPLRVVARGPWHYTIERSIGTETDKLDDSYYNGKPARAALTGDITTSPSTHAILQETAPAGYWATKR